MKMVSIEDRLDAAAEKFPEIKDTLLKRHEVPGRRFWEGPRVSTKENYAVKDVKYLDEQLFHVVVTNEQMLVGPDDREFDSRIGIYLKRKEDGKRFSLATPVVPHSRVGHRGLADYYGGYHRSGYCFVNDLGCHDLEVGYCDEYGREEKEVHEDSGNGLVSPTIGQQRRYTVHLQDFMQDLWRNRQFDSSDR
jgi:hypothetical protein